MLYIVSTPIGNLEDITLRALRTLKEVDYIACEDTRTTATLLNHYEIKKSLLSYHSYSGVAKLDKIIALLNEGKDIALVSDAGTPGISDPGYPLIQEALKNNIRIIPIPGVSAFLTALQASGLPINHFLYFGFLPIKKGRQTLFKKLQTIEETVVFYESVHRIERTLRDLGEYLGEDRKIVIARELTKKFEEFNRVTIKDAIDIYCKKEKQKGEFVIII
ncbi:MAG: 16S rRNA (cytidine(1402)-2'-O)-methyltransferase [Candidatus Gracilibacteria bacterium]|nr:16S rRNA (cytidine(1402)-2'-O)-methyltransferase [Candidatus Gracilibacteria bacterium]